MAARVDTKRTWRMAPPLFGNLTQRPKRERKADRQVCVDTLNVYGVYIHSTICHVSDHRHSGRAPDLSAGRSWHQGTDCTGEAGRGGAIAACSAIGCGSGSESEHCRYCLPGVTEGWTDPDQAWIGFGGCVAHHYGTEPR